MERKIEKRRSTLRKARMIEKIIDCDLFFLLGFELSLHWIPKIPTKERKRKWVKDREKKEKGEKKFALDSKNPDIVHVEK